MDREEQRQGGKSVQRPSGKMTAADAQKDKQRRQKSRNKTWNKRQKRCKNKGSSVGTAADRSSAKRREKNLKTPDQRLDVCW